MKFIELRIAVKTMTTSDGRSFPIYETVTKDGVKRAVKFTRDVTNPPKASCYVTCPLSAVHDGKDRRGYKCVWVREVSLTRPLFTEDDLIDELGDIGDIFDDDGKPV